MADPDAAKARIRRSTLVLIVINLLPLGGVLLLGWDLAALIVLYWSENLIIGFYNILKMLTATGVLGTLPSLFFLIHYGGFCAAHGLFITTMLLGESDSPVAGLSWPLFLVFLELLWNVTAQVLAAAPQAWIIAFVGLGISHGYSFVNNFLLSGERENATISELMAAPYKRIVILHVAILISSFGVLALGEPLLLLLAMVALKTAMDIGLHRREHRRFLPA